MKQNTTHTYGFFSLPEFAHWLLTLTACTILAATAAAQSCGEGPMVPGGYETFIAAQQSLEASSAGSDNMAVSGTHALIGRYDGNTGEEFVVAYERNAEGAWEEIQTLTEEVFPGHETDDYATAVEIVGDYAFVSAPSYGDDSGECGAPGRVYVYRYVEQEGQWQRTAAIEGTDNNPAPVNAYFGNYLASSEEGYVAIGYEDGGCDDVSIQRANVYELVGQEWQYHSTYAPARANDTYVEWEELSMDGLRILSYVDRENEAVPTSYQDDLLLYEYSESEGQWLQTALIEEPDEETYFDSYQLDGNAILISATSFEYDSQLGGYDLIVYEETAQGNWQLKQTLRQTPRSSNYYESPLYEIAFANGRIFLSDTTTYIGEKVPAVFIFKKSAEGIWEVNNVLPNPESGGSTFGSAIITDGSTLLVDSYDAPGDNTDVAFFYNIIPVFSVPATEVPACAAPAYRPEVVSECGVSITGDYTLGDPGTYSPAWRAIDAAGNQVIIEQRVTVTNGSFPLPLEEGFDDASTLGCWTADPAWVASEGAYRLSPSGEQTDENTLTLPVLDLVAGTTYAIGFRYRSLSDDGGGRLTLSGPEGPLFADASAPGELQYVEVLVTPAEDGPYALTFSSPRDEVAAGLLLDEVSVVSYTEPATDGASLLAGTGDGLCTSVRAQGISGDGWQRVLTADGKLLAEINANGNDLGDVVVRMTDYADAPTAPFTAAAQLGRYYGITPENGSGPYTANGGVRIRLYVTDDELAQLAAASGDALGWEDLLVTHYSGANDDCDLLNSSDVDFTTEKVEATGDYGQSAHYVAFTTRTFSEFGISYRQAVSVTPEWAKPFAGMEVFPNPTDDRVTLRLSTPTATDIRLEMRSLLGSIVYTRRFRALAGENRLEIPLDHFPRGTYLLLASDDERAGTVRVVKR